MYVQWVTKKNNNSTLNIMRFESTLKMAFTPLQAFLPPSLSVMWNDNIKTGLKEHAIISAPGFCAQDRVQW
jgi:hypothetical protein